MGENARDAAARGTAAMGASRTSERECEGRKTKTVKQANCNNKQRIRSSSNNNSIHQSATRMPREQARQATAAAAASSQQPASIKSPALGLVRGLVELVREACMHHRQQVQAAHTRQHTQVQALAWCVGPKQIRWPNTGLENDLID